MEGKFITRGQRTKLVDEIKKSHFKLGNYTPHPRATLNLPVESTPGINSLSSGMRSTHFELGKDKPVKKSESNSRFVPHDQVVGSGSSKTAITDYSKTHFVLGMSSGNQDKEKKEKRNEVLISKPEFKYTANLSGAHHFVYGTDERSLKSTSAQDYVEKQVPMQDKQEVKNLKSELQKSHFGLGNVKEPYLSTTKASFQGPVVRQERKNGDLMNSHFKFGTDKVKYDSRPLNSDTQVQGRQDFNEGHLKDLRKSHFELGNDKVAYKLSSQELLGTEVIASDPSADLLLRKTNFKLGTSEKTWKTSYGQSHSSTPLSQTKPMSDTVSDKISHFTLGSATPCPALSVHRNDFQHFKPTKTGGDVNQGQFVRGHHYKLGNFKEEHKSQNEKYGQGKLEASNENKIVQDLRVSHFCLGNDKRENLTTNQESFKGLRGSVSSQSFKNNKNLGIHSVKGNWITEQKSRFGWVKPVADDCFKFSFE